MITISDLDFRYPSGEFRLRISEFVVAESEKVAVVGPSGSGKTTLLNLIAGILISANGIVKVENTTMNELADDRRRDFRISNVGFVFQDFELLDYLSVLDNILHPYRITKALSLNKAVRQRAVETADALGIGEMLKRYPEDLSKGEKQRVAICRAILSKPKLILADEPTGNLDPDNKTKILDLLFHSVEEHKATLLAVTHDTELLKRFDRVIDFMDFSL
jgi:putative ABC transport system ATP-binding protein